MAYNSGSVKNPENEAEDPAPSRGITKDKGTEGGPSTQSDERGRKNQNPEGQQGQTGPDKR